MDFICPSRCSKIGYDLGSIHQDRCLWQDKQHTWWLGTNTSQTQVIATLSLLFAKFPFHWFMPFLLFCSLQHKTCTTNYFSPRSNVLEVHTGFHHPTSLATKYTVVLEQKQKGLPFPMGKGGWALKCLWGLLGSLLQVNQKVAER